MLMHFFNVIIDIIELHFIF